VESSQRRDAFLNGIDRGIEPEGMGDHDAHTGTGDRLTDTSRLPNIDGHRFFQKDVFTAMCRFFAYRYVEGWGKGYHDGIDGPIGQEVGIGLEIAASVLLGLPFSLIGIATPEADEVYLGEILIDMFGVPTSMFADTDEADAKRGFHDLGSARQSEPLSF